MALDFEKIARLVDLQYQQKEQSLQRIRQDQQRLRDQADTCEKEALDTLPGESLQDALALEKWLCAQRAKAAQLRQQAASLDQIVAELQQALRKDLKRVTGLEMMRAHAQRQAALQEAEKQDDELLAIAALKDRSSA
ncbi:hypothetical protein [Parvularcula sp. IMCC14364]|uniref:hypothetical protein n=1 Tax=Parvularcula sp. IMCC14364 TaxID=3067902 RepID=UPI0027415A5F|nr:hypothetical protein [Parvularcula sp. IMCC14364]